MITTIYDTATIFRREFVARRDLLLAATYVALLVVLVPYLPFISHLEHTDVRDLSSVALTLGAGLALSIGLGATFFGRDLSEGRLGFYFERPVSSVAVWLGRFLAVLTLVVLCEVLILLPAKLSSADGLTIMTYVGWPKSFGAAGWAVVLVAAPAFLLLLAHAASVMVRARTAWLVLDVVGVTSVGIAAWLCLRPFVVDGFDDALLVVSLALAAGALVALLAGFAVGVHSGRCDLGRAHRALSITLWSVVAMTFGGVAAYSAWLGDFEPSELGEFRVLDIAANGEWIEVQGTSPGRLDVERRFLISTLDSRWLRLPRRWYAEFSKDGQRALLPAAGHRDEPGTVNYVDLDGRDLEPVATSIMIDSDTYKYLSPNGSRLAILDQGVLSVYDLDDERLLTAVRLPEEFEEARPFFVDESTMRFHHRSGEPGDWTISIAEIEASTGTVEHTGSFPVGFERFSIAWNADLSYLAVTDYRYGDSSRIGNIFDARTGEFIRPIADFAAFLHDGRVLMIARDGYKAKSIVVEEPTGGNRVEHDLAEVLNLSIIGEGRSGYLLLAYSSNFSTGYISDGVDALNLETGATENIGEGLRPDGGYNWADGRGWYRREPAGHRLFWKDPLTLVRWDPDRGELVPVVVGLAGD